MFGKRFYNKTIRNTTAIFGTLFNDIWIGRDTKDGRLINQKKVPIAFGPRDKFIQRIEQQPDLDAAKVAIQLPRMSFEYDAPVADYERQRNKRTFIREGTSKIKSPAAYRVTYRLSIFSKTEDESLQIIEQILPYFMPSIGVKIKPVHGREDIEDTILFTLTGVNKEDRYEGEYNSRTTLIYTLTFDATINLYRDLSKDYSDIVIKRVNINILNEDSDDILFADTYIDPADADEDEVFDFIYEESYSNDT